MPDVDCRLKAKLKKYIVRDTPKDKKVDNPCILATLRASE